MTTEELTVTVSEELAAAVKIAAAAVGQSISAFTAAALRLELIAVEAGACPTPAHRTGAVAPQFADVMTVLALPEEATPHPVRNG